MRSRPDYYRRDFADLEPTLTVIALQHCREGIPYADALHLAASELLDTLEHWPWGVDGWN